jgi:predicted short-subunit dehydrogenase-like oxidoreductase (DUF2520 family)
MLKIGFIGAGTVGTALAVLLSGQHYEVVAVSSRSRSSADKLAKRVHGCRAFDGSQAVADAAELVFVTTPDAAIAEVAAGTRWHDGQSVIHCSGADSVAILEPARQANAMVGGFHPLQTFAGFERAIENIPGSTFAIESQEPLRSTLKTMCTHLGGNWIELKAEDKVPYHAAAVFASNYLVTLVKMATDLWQTFGIPPDRATAALMPLMRGTLHNIETLGFPQCLTGPIARGDAGTIEKHLAVLQNKTPDLLYAYKELGLQTIPIALAKGKIDSRQAGELEIALKKS